MHRAIYFKREELGGGLTYKFTIITDEYYYVQTNYFYRDNYQQNS